MPRDLGVKHTCFKCATKFYDMNKPTPICPKCGADQRESPAKLEPAAADRKRPRAKRADDDDLPVAAAVSDEVEGTDEEEESVDETEDEDDAEDAV